MAAAVCHAWNPGKQRYLAWWCPGCKQEHWVPVDDRHRQGAWEFDGNMAAPSIKPSVRHFIPAQPADADGPATPEQTLCHYFVTKGVIEFQGDCRHGLKGQKLPLEAYETIAGVYHGA